jgi:non-ribosomal peptide synthetase-like protein
MTIDLRSDARLCADLFEPRGVGSSESSRGLTLLDIFAATTRRHPGRPALETSDATLSYRELGAAVDELAARLRSGGVGPGDRVGVRIASGTADLYVSILAILHAGAAYVPVDADDPAARAEQILSDAKVCALVGAGREIAWRGPTGGRAGSPRPDDDAWVIFTSGSTGLPKGVAVTHRSAAAFVLAEDALWEIRPEDRVLAGLSVAFDASCEEMWLAWAHGATLVPAPRQLVRSGMELGPWLRDRAITVISTVPTLAAIWDDASLRDVRLLILGGEACPEPLAWRLSAEREVWNTYGPTEATVVSTAARMRPGHPVTIGAALPGWLTAVVDEADTPVQPGEAGELVIGGVGLGRYLQADLDDERYRGLAALGWPRAYRTGDIVRETPDGLQFVGRRDHQVKIGGRRIELGEIDGQLSALDGVRAACTVVRETAAGNRLLVGYVAGEIDPAAARAQLAEAMPESLVPMIVVLDELPVATSGKVNRSALPWPPPASGPAAGPRDGSLTDAQAALAARWREQLGPMGFTTDSDFFACGGTSLAAAKLVTALRHEWPTVAVADIYAHRTLAELADHLEALEQRGADRRAADDPAGGPSAAAIDPARELPTRRQRLTLAALQLFGVLVLFAVQGIPWLIAGIAYGDLVPVGSPHVGFGWLGLAWLVLASPPAHVALQVLANRSLLRGLHPGRYSRYSSLAARLWFVDRLSEATHFDRLGGTPWAARYARLAGADIGVGARLGTVPPAGALLSIGAGATIESSVDMRGWWIDGQQVVVGSITVGPRARIGSRTLLEPGAVVGPGAEVEVGSVVGGVIPADERWGGVPARRIGRAGEEWPVQAPPPMRSRRRFHALFALSLGLEGGLGLLAIAPAVIVLHLLAVPLPTLRSSLGSIALEVLVATLLIVPATALVLAGALRLVWRLVTPGWHHEHELVGWALWFGEELKQTASTLLFPLYASLFTRRWFALMGLRVGRRAEISVATGINPLVSFGELSQCTDDIGFCGVRSRDGWISVEPIEVGKRSFLGPGSILRGGTRIGPDSLVGVMTLAPRTPDPATSWLGVPAIELPRARDCADPRRTTDPPRRLIAARAGMDTLRLFAPNAVALLIEVLEVGALLWIGAHAGLAGMILAAPVVPLVGGLTATGLTVALKWLVIGRYRRSDHPLWSHFVWRDELMNAAQEQLADELLLRFAVGTPIMSAYLRAMGARVGRGVWCETTAVTEYDMIELGDAAAVNREGCLMTHLFHDRLLRIGPTRLAPGASLGPSAVVLPDTVVGAGTCVTGHSVVLRGEELPEHTRWQGTPVAPVTGTAPGYQATPTRSRTWSPDSTRSATAIA